MPSTLTVIVTPGYTFAAGELLTVDKLNLLANPGVAVSGTVTTADLATGSITTDKLAAGVLSNDTAGRTKMADGYLSVTADGRAKMADGFLSADATGQAKMADGFLTANSAGLLKMADGYLPNSVAGRLKVADGFLSADAGGRAKLADLFITEPKISTGFGIKVVQMVSAATATNSFTALNIPVDNTIPQIGEGFLLLSRAITPTAVGNNLLVEISTSLSSVQNNVAAVFRDATANALEAQWGNSATNGTTRYNFGFVVTAVSLAATTFSLRVGASSGNCWYNNDGASNWGLGGVMKTWMKITEYAP